MILMKGWSSKVDFKLVRIDILSFEIETINNILKSVSELNFLEVRSEDFWVYLENERKMMLVECLKEIRNDMIKELKELGVTEYDDND